MTPDEYEDIAYELNHELGQAERREIDRRVEHAQAARPEHGLSLPCTGCAGNHLAGQHHPGSQTATCARCAEIAASTPQTDAQHLAAADDSLNSPTDEGA